MEIDYLRLIKKHKAIFIIFPLVTAIISLFFAYRQPPLYQSSAKIYVKENGNLQIVYAAIKSEAILNGVIDKLNSVGSLKAENIDKAKKTISNNLEAVLDSRTNVIEIRFNSLKKELSTETLNAIIFELEKNYPEMRLKETANNPFGFKIIDKTISSVVAMSVFLSVLAALCLSLIIEFFSSRGSKEAR